MNKGRIALLAVVGLMASGCATTYYVGSDPETYFTYPNSNVIPLEETQGEASNGSMVMTAEGQKRAIENALSKVPGADTLINAQWFVKQSTVLFFTSSTSIVRGTAAEVEVGEQELSMGVEDDE